MKRVLALVLVLCFFSAVWADNNLTSAQLRLRSEIEQFLREEGFVPSINANGNINFKREGHSYGIYIDSRDDNPMFVEIYRVFSMPDKPRNLVKATCAVLNEYKGVKLSYFEDQLELVAEMYLVDVENFKLAFYKLLKQMDALVEAYDEGEEEARKFINN